ncbi:MAG: phosphate ABC transporter permease subunit PstC [Caulobacter sp.]|nr:phosphate ABC transporter permease subunit PstC [Caulobacter sp.]
MSLTVVIVLLLAFSGGVYWLGRRRAVAQAQAETPLHSLPGYYGTWVALWTGVPALLLLLLFLTVGPRVGEAMLSANPPAAVAQMPPETAQAFWSDARALAGGRATSAQPWTAEERAALDAKVVEARRFHNTLTWGSFALAGVLALAGFLLAWPRIKPGLRARNRVESWLNVALIACSAVAVLTTLGIIASLMFEALRFFQVVSPLDFLFGLDWQPQIAMRADQVAAKGAFGAVPLFAGTFLIMLIAMCVAAPVGLFCAIYLSEYAGSRTRSVIKPLLEVLAGVPTVVYGFFAVLTVGPAFRAFFNYIGSWLVEGPIDPVGRYLMGVQGEMALTAGFVMGIMLIPYISSLSDDIINAVPQSLRDGSYAMGATRSETVKKVVLPAALPGVMGAMLLAISRAIGETMIVTMAAGSQARITANPLDSVTTVTRQMVELLTGDQAFDNAMTLSAFGLGLTLFVVTLTLNVIALRVVQKYRQAYD